MDLLRDQLVSIATGLGPPMGPKGKNGLPEGYGGVLQGRQNIKTSKHADLQGVREWAIQDSNLGPLPYQAASDVAGDVANPAWILRIRLYRRLGPCRQTRADYGRLRPVVAGLPIQFVASLPAESLPLGTSRGQRPQRHWPGYYSGCTEG